MELPAQTTTVPVVIDGAEVGFPEELVAKAEIFEAAAMSARTRKAYASVWNGFLTWCADQRLDPTSIEVVRVYLADRAGEKKLATLGVHLAAITSAYQLMDLEKPSEHPRIRTLMKGIRRTLGPVPQTKKAPLTVAQLRGISPRLGYGRKGARDRALHLLGFAGALRRSEMVGLDVDDLTEQEEGLVLPLRRSKTDRSVPEGRSGSRSGPTP